MQCPLPTATSGRFRRRGDDSIPTLPPPSRSTASAWACVPTSRCPATPRAGCWRSSSSYEAQPADWAAQPSSATLLVAYGDLLRAQRQADAASEVAARPEARRRGPRSLPRRRDRARHDRARHAGAVRRAAGAFLGQPFRGLDRKAAGRSGWPAPSRSRRSGRTCWAGSRTCWSRSSAIRRCCSISIRPLDRPRAARRPCAPPRRNPERKRGLNENLAREILELHTLGVRSGYSQADVTEFARALTGWSVGGVGRGPCATRPGTDAGRFRVRPGAARARRAQRHGPRYEQPAKAQAPPCCATSRPHPATARHIATKLARHFVARRPAAGAGRPAGRSLPDAAAATCRAVYRALIESPEAWAPAAGQVQDAVGVDALGPARRWAAATCAAAGGAPC